MIDKNTIMKLNSNNVSKNPEVTIKNFDCIWKGASNIQKNEAVSLGGYTDTRSFTNAKNQSAFSVRMIVAISITFGVNPFWLSAEKDEKGNCTTENIDSFLELNGFKKYCSYNMNNIIKEQMVDYFEDFISKVPKTDMEKINMLSDEEYMTLFKSFILTNRDINRMKIIKTLLLF